MRGIDAMIISHRKKFVVLTPWRTASGAIRARLGRWCDSPYSAFHEFNPYLNRIVHRHMTYADFACLPESHLGYFCASFVRNPYDRVFSAFLQLQRDFTYKPRAPAASPWVATLVKREAWENYALMHKAGFSFDRWLELMADDQVLECGHNSSFPLHPAHYWTHVNGRQAVDFVGRVERFECDFSALCGRVGIDSGDCAALRSEASPGRAAAPGRPGPSGSTDTGKMYKYASCMSARSIARINVLFHADFELFDYAPLKLYQYVATPGSTCIDQALMPPVRL
jgi:hypothetical protein